MSSPRKKKKLFPWIWDLWCVVSIVGIWPRFIEPRLIDLHRLTLPINNLPPSLQGLKIIHFSDLHLNRTVSQRFLAKLANKINRTDPDLILFTGDLLCYSHLKEPEELRQFLCSLKARYGCFASLGNHDYAECVSINGQGDYDILTREDKAHPLGRAFSRLLSSQKLTGKVTPAAAAVPLHQPLVELLAQTPFKLLHNESVLVAIDGSFINICGLGEYMAGRFLPEAAYQNYRKEYPGIILSHNPDTAPLLAGYPGDLILSGHTHGGQVNLPFMWKKFTLLENQAFKKGLLKVNGKWLYVSRGVGGVLNFRWFAMPEVLLLTLRKDDA